MRFSFLILLAPVLAQDDCPFCLGCPDDCPDDCPEVCMDCVDCHDGHHCTTEVIWRAHKLCLDFEHGWGSFAEGTPPSRYYDCRKCSRGTYMADPSHSEKTKKLVRDDRGTYTVDDMCPPKDYQGNKEAYNECLKKGGVDPSEYEDYMTKYE